METKLVQKVVKATTDEVVAYVPSMNEAHVMVDILGQAHPDGLKIHGACEIEVPEEATPDD